MRTFTYRQELAREQRIQDGIASRLKYSFNNNMSSIKIVYRYLHGSGQGFEKFWKKIEERVDYKCIANHKLYDEEMLLEAEMRAIPMYLSRICAQILRNLSQLLRK